MWRVHESRQRQGLP
jgi:hypothetical protein